MANPCSSSRATRIHMDGAPGGEAGSLSRKALLLALSVLLSGPAQAGATEDYALETGQVCAVCHMAASGGGGLTAAGEAYSEDPGAWTPPSGTPAVTPFPLRLVHAVLLYAHVFFGIIWVGTILYVHLVLKPRYALGGLPRSELRLAWLSMPVLGTTGLLLTVWRWRLAPGLFSTFFGKLLLVKIVVFLLMFSSAAFVTLYIGPRLKAMAARHDTGVEIEGKDTYTLEELARHSGSGGGPVLIAAEGGVYDVSASSMWKGGIHARRHKAGEDLTEYLDDAPHGPEVLSRYEKIGQLVKTPARTPPVVKVFTVNAYFNLAGCFVIILVLVLWRW